MPTTATTKLSKNMQSTCRSTCLRPNGQKPHSRKFELPSSPSPTRSGKRLASTSLQYRNAKSSDRSFRCQCGQLRLWKKLPGVASADHTTRTRCRADASRKFYAMAGTRKTPHRQFCEAGRPARSAACDRPHPRPGSPPRQPDLPLADQGIIGRMTAVHHKKKRREKLRGES